MTIQPLATTGQTGGAAAPSPSTAPDAVNQDQFMQLLVAQIKYQDPTSPTDSTAFVTQLAQFSSLEQLVAIRSDLENQNVTSATAAQNAGSTQGGN